MHNIIALVLGGGRGTRLFPLTQVRSKPAVPLAGKYRLIDIPLSNCLNSGLNQIYVLTQFNSVSLHRHIRRTYTFDAFGGGFVECSPRSRPWTTPTGTRARPTPCGRTSASCKRPGIEYVLILSGDQLYRMNYNDMLATHVKNKADVTIGALPCSREDAAGFGIMRLDDSGRVMGFLEKPKTEADLALVRTDPAWIDARGIASRGRDCLASMGIYLFNRDKLVDLLTKTDYHDFGKEIFPASIRTHRVQVHMFDGYWEDIGTIKSFYQCNLDLARTRSAVRFEFGRVADLHAFAVPAPFAVRRGHGHAQPDFRRLDDCRREPDREQRDRSAVPHRQERDDPQFDRDGLRLLPDA